MAKTKFPIFTKSNSEGIEIVEGDIEALEKFGRIGRI